MKNEINSAQTPSELLSDLKSLVRDAEAILSSSVSEHSTEAFDAIRERFSLAQDRLSHLYASARKRVVAGATCTNTAIRENPYQSLALAFGVGLVAGVLIRRRSS
ncbi:MAG: DUF883 domain-containing protein [Opitutaceae bacterium]|nr:DUF883 domain-containing protein [Opitutaceae bacterium]